MKKVKVIIERGSDNRYSAYMDCYDFDFGLAGFGNTSKEAIADFYEAWEEEKAMYAKENKIAPEIEFDIQYDVASFLDYFSQMLSKSGLEKITGVNQKQLWHYHSGIRSPKSATVKKIQNGLYSFADELKQVRFID
jgi:predicted RNase H-like HicB family nuclease